ncbi:MAG TPA: DNA-binding response regulator [Elusimicrobia bacterium]|jgi:DNA-binding NarL/FixJ family response regulator|nr:DNA-binding response regulator [Elusimicrobiota bacterium]
MLRVLIADDHAVVRQGLKQILREEFPQGIYGESENAQEVLRQVREQDWDIVILDVTLGNRSGLEVLAEIKTMCPKLPVLVLSMHPEDQYGVRMLKSGADGYLTKESAPEEIVKAIRKILAGGKYVSPSLAERLVLELENNTNKLPHEKLSDREYQVMLMIASGKTVTEIAEVVHLSVKTISTYRERILEKMGMKNNAELIHYAVKNHLVE